MFGNNSLERAQQAIDVPLPAEVAIKLAGGEDDLVERDAEAAGDELEKAPLHRMSALGVADSPFGNAAAGGEFELRQPQRTAEAGELGAMGLQ